MLDEMWAMRLHMPIFMAVRALRCEKSRTGRTPVHIPHIVRCERVAFLAGILTPKAEWSARTRPIPDIGLLLCIVHVSVAHCLSGDYLFQLPL